MFFYGGFLMDYALITFFDYWFELKKKVREANLRFIKEFNKFYKKKKYLKYKISLGINKDVYILH